MGRAWQREVNVDGRRGAVANKISASRSFWKTYDWKNIINNDHSNTTYTGRGRFLGASRRRKDKGWILGGIKARKLRQVL